MGKSYSQLTTDERNFIQRSLNEGLKQAEIARRLGRSRSTVGGEVARGFRGTSYDAVTGGAVARSRRHRGRRKLAEDSPLLGAVRLMEGWSPEQIAGRLKQDHPQDKVWHVLHETCRKSPNHN